MKRGVAALSVLLIACLITNLRAIHDEVARDPVVARLGARLERVRDIVPPLTVVGYVADSTLVENRTIDVDALMEFRLAQFQLAPAILENRRDTPLLLGDFRNPLSERTFLADPSWRVVHDYGSGLLLLERSDR